MTTADTVAAIVIAWAAAFVIAVVAVALGTLDRTFLPASSSPPSFAPIPAPTAAQIPPREVDLHPLPMVGGKRS